VAGRQAPEFGVELPDEAVAPPSEPDPGLVDEDSDRCFSWGCADWHVEAVDHRNVWVDRDFIVHAGRDGLLGIDAHTGQLRWSIDAAEDASAYPWAHDVVGAIGSDAVAVANGSMLTVHDRQDGTERFEFELPFERAHWLSWSDSNLVVGGGPRYSSTGTHLQVYSAAGELLATHRSADVIEGDGGRLLLVRTPSGHLQRISTADGRVLWETGEPLDESWVDVGDFGIRVRDSQHIMFLDPSDGAVSTTFAADTLVRAHRDSPYLTVRDEDTWVVIDARSGRRLLSRPADPMSADGPYVARLDGNMLGVEPLDETQRVRVFLADAQGRLLTEAVLPLDFPVRPLSGVELVDRTAGMVDLIFGDGLSVVRINTDPIQTLARQHITLHEDAEARLESSRHPGLTVVRRGAITQLFGIERMIEIPGHARAASSDPLILHGNNSGMLRIDRQLLDPNAAPAA
jgi:outer membrane protein assembly factor BamB